MQNFKLGNFNVGVNYPPIFFCEIGSYYNGDEAQALRYIDKILMASKQSLHTPVILKTEILSNPNICLPEGIEEHYTDKKGTLKQENFRTLIERKVMPLESYGRLFKYLNKAKMPFVISVYDFEAIDFSMRYSACALKIASANIVHIPLIRYAAKQGVPLVIDTGRSTLAEVFNAVDTARSVGCQEIIIQHSPDGHPALAEAHNLRILQSYQQSFNLPVGLSDHYVGLEMMYLSIALGASVIEKGLSFDPEELDQDISHSMDIGQLSDVLIKIYECWLALGSTQRDKRKPIKGNIGTSQRPGLIAKKNLFKGDRVSLDNIGFAFPCKGIPAEKWDEVDNWIIDKDVESGRPVTWSNVIKEKEYVTETA